MESNSVEDVKIDILDTTELLPLIKECISNDSCNVIFVATDKILEMSELDEELKSNLAKADAVFPSANIKIQDSEDSAVKDNKISEKVNENVVIEEPLDNEVNDTYSIDEKLVTEITSDTDIEKLSIMVMTDDVSFSEVVKNKIDGLSETFDFVGEYVFDNEIEDDLVINDINANLPDILLCSFSSPLQEKWVIENKNKMNVKLCLCLSGEVGNSMFKKDTSISWITRLFTKTSLFGIL